MRSQRVGHDWATFTFTFWASAVGEPEGLKVSSLHSCTLHAQLRWPSCQSEGQMVLGTWMYLMDVKTIRGCYDAMSTGMSSGQSPCALWGETQATGPHSHGRGRAWGEDQTHPCDHLEQFGSSDRPWFHLEQTCSRVSHWHHPGTSLLPSPPLHGGTLVPMWAQLTSSRPLWTFWASLHWVATVWSACLLHSRAPGLPWRIALVQLLSHVWLFGTPWTAARQASLSFTISWSLLKLMSIKFVFHTTILSSVVPFSSCFQPFPASGSFPMSWLFPSGGQCIGTSASASVLPMNIQDWLPLGLTGFISLQSKGISRVFSNTRVWRHQFFSALPSLWSNSHINTWLMEKS